MTPVESPAAVMREHEKRLSRIVAAAYNTNIDIESVQVKYKYP